MPLSGLIRLAFGEATRHTLPTTKQAKQRWCIAGEPGARTVARGFSRGFPSQPILQARVAGDRLAVLGLSSVARYAG
jgi:hypothetical protein